MAAAATPSPETALPAADDKEDEDECRICRLPADADRPLRRPCGCRGSMRFVHDDCQLQWIARRRKLPRCEVCRRRISIRPLYAADALVRLPVSELMAGLPSKLIGLLLPLFFAVCVVREFVVPLTTCWAWRLALAADFARAHHLLSLRLPMASWTCIPASVALCMELARLVAPFSVAPFARWVARLVAQIQSQEPGLYEALQVLAIFAVEVSLVADRDAAKALDDVAIDAYDQQVSAYSDALSAYRDDLSAYTQWCNDDARAVVVLTASVLPQFASEFMGLGTVAAMWLLVDCCCCGCIFFLTITGIYTVRRLAAVRTVSRAVVAWLAALIFNSAVLLLPISVGRALLFSIPQLLVADGLKSNDLFAVAVGLCIISTIIAACRDLSAHLISGETCLLALQRHLLLCIWSVVVPLLMGLLVDLSLTSPFFVGRDDEFPATSFFRTWLLGRIFKQLWIKCLVDKRWKAKLDRAKEDLSAGLGPMWWFFQDMCVPVVVTLLAALVVPYVLARGVFPGLGYPTAVNSTVYRFAWSGGLGVCALCWLAKGLCVMLHDSIKEDRYAIGRRLEDVGDGS
ncbi:probable E3 ubiquitin ligase SUD1 [Triticum dicoccoides]|uniref:probable E3 ubiquitin ligase SUD1 n=1 Tax=Triticum dicoccoides TaxID=85692 RepID=UPI00188F7949|nr:probable E3 ubiquitin ligase SUD1 [Triticum dicoccoides]